MAAQGISSGHVKTGIGRLAAYFLMEIVRN